MTEVNVSDVGTQEDLNERCRAAAFIGTLQAGFTDFHYLRPIWRETTEKDALIGVGMTGIASGKVLSLNLEEAADVVKNENARVAKIIGINKAARCTTIKPSGTTSCVLGTSSGIHAWHDQHYVRRMRFNKTESIYTYMLRTNPSIVEDEIGNERDGAVIAIPLKAPEGAILRAESALSMLERVRKFSTGWVRNGHRNGDNTHNVSATVNIKDDEWDDVGEWMWENKSVYNGLSVLPHDGGTYSQMPFTSCTAEEYEAIVQALTQIDLTKVKEDQDYTDFSAQPSCAGGACELTEV